MKFYINPTAYSTMRVWVELSGVPMQQFLKDTLDVLSCWGGADKRGENYISWEIGGDVVAAVRRFLTKYDYAVMISEINNRSYYWIVLASDSLEELKAMKYTRGVRFLKRAEFDSLPELPVT